jgi:hypothetical protein
MPRSDVHNGSVILRGVEIALDSDVGAGFVVDCARHVEELISPEQLKAKYQLTEEAWRHLADNESLQQALERARERRIRSGEAAKERAQHLFLAAPTVLSDILNDDTASPRHRIEAARELRQTAAIGSEAATATTEHFSIRIDLTAGGNKDDVIVIDTPIRKAGPDAGRTIDHDDDPDTAPLLALIAANRNRGDGEP